MNEDTTPEKLTIDTDKIIHILLKHLMSLKNENTYLAKRVGLNNVGDDMPENTVGGNNVQGGRVKISLGGDNVNSSESENTLGEINVQGGRSKISLGGDNVNSSESENTLGEINVQGSRREIKEGINTDSSLYYTFEKELINALNQYIKNEDGQNTLYTFYEDFQQAVAIKNEEDEKIKTTIANLTLEETRSLPSQIAVDVINTYQLNRALHGHLPSSSVRSAYDTVAEELLLLHNAGKATAAQLRGFSKLSVDGFAKHLTKLQEYGLIKKQPPSNYVLTEKSIHILLKTFGVPKNK